MGIFSFGKKDDAPTRRGANTSSTRAARGERVERRTRRTERTVDADAMLLDPTLPEKQRARRRLVGAIALVVAAVVILPMVLDSHPKPVTDDISIDIPNRPAPKVAKTDEDTQAGVAPDNPAPDAALAASGLAPTTAATQSQSGAAKQQSAATSAAPAVKPAVKPQAPAAVAANTAPAAPVAQAPAKPVKAPATQSAANVSAPSEDSANTAAAGADANSGTPASPPGSRFAVQLGAFANDANARSWATKLKAAGVPAYTEHRKQADGSTLTLLRAGPFADRAAATAAIAKVREAGLTSGANSGAAQ
ncbi:Cell division protein DedD [Paraburkholderia domus]|uniref:Cell division protein DedD n=1 Tax=Paraburkholderia domus TaxID=2793075 RepID=A0A9N8MU44_9BURK|nr:SPOR domain-containing protein [Paraburkholderia domus]MBK5051138.1 SPOR domain-containing protein [Burkholderia sp. R-70006]MBK5061110.1 SPOR domain-containing protein [Burkholderia sp. R-70199]MBK5088160.1 SPOR domain-containing protein [Burkholderia sp. R-69927]MBK5121162.1 SPOR domain-containing protein [Burkholderia sp. R-69980]MBK5166305.1 SPOR domain-containing protein [Burkholderia sp. R-70211]MBK5179520.1 SPOR domain-containing protein [Burkholderia sp. R-69749]MCI0146459.1 SPOR 